jgi:uncharacterized LabA/DUF88 family protein
VIHEPDVFVWHRGLLSPDYGEEEIRRVTYYTSAVGDDEKISAIQRQIGDLKFRGRTRSGGWPFTHTPRVFKKPAKTHRSRLVDVSLTIDVLQQVHSRNVRDVGILSGDGDFLPLIRAAKQGGARVTVLAFSDGLSPLLRDEADAFHLLDDYFLV